MAQITSSFVVDSLEALSGTCTSFLSTSDRGYVSPYCYRRHWDATKPHCTCREHAGHLAADFCLATVVVVLHGTVLMCQGMAFSVAVNSKRSHALVALLIASNFVEIKGDGSLYYFIYWFIIDHFFIREEIYLSCFIKLLFYCMKYAKLIYFVFQRNLFIYLDIPF